MPDTPTSSMVVIFVEQKILECGMKKAFTKQVVFLVIEDNKFKLNEHRPMIYLIAQQPLKLDNSTFLQEFFPKHLEPQKLSFNQGEKTLESSNTTPDGRKTILIFHCEFSSARGPGLLRMLRKKFV